MHRFQKPGGLLLALCFALAAPGPGAHAQPRPIEPGVTPGTPLAQLPKALKDAAEAGLRTFRSLVDARNYARLGFESPQEVQAATLGEPLRDVFVPLDKLRTYSGGGDIKPLLVRGPRVLFPVQIGSAVRSSLTVVQQPDGGFKAASFGARSFARAFSAAREAAAQASGAKPESFFIVRVPALNAQFLAFDQAAGLMFVVVTDDPRFDLRAGSTLPAAEVLGRLVARARSLQDDAPG